MPKDFEINIIIETSAVSNKKQLKMIINSIFYKEKYDMIDNEKLERTKTGVESGWNTLSHEGLWVKIIRTLLQKRRLIKTFWEEKKKINK